MGGDEFVLIASRLKQQALSSKKQLLNDLASKAGFEVCRQDMLSLSMGVAVFPEDGNDPEKLLAEADRRMYAEKQGRAAHAAHREIASENQQEAPPFMMLRLEKPRAF